MRHALLALLALLALTTSGCRLRTAVDLVVNGAGGGNVQITVNADRELTDELRAGGSDPLLGLAEVIDGPWTVVDTDDGPGGVSVVLGADFARPSELAARVDELNRQLGEAGGSLAQDVSLELTEDGQLVLRGSFGLLPPTLVGASGDGIDVDVDDLQAFLLAQGDEVARLDLRVTMPGSITTSDADEVVDATASWRLPIGSARTIQVASSTGDFPVLLVGAAAGAAVLAGGAAFALRRRRSAG